MPNSYYEVGTIGSTPIYEKLKARKRNLGKLYTQEELDQAVKDEREACLKGGLSYAMYNTPFDMCQGSSLRAYSKAVDNFAKAIRKRGDK